MENIFALLSEEGLEIATADAGQAHAVAAEIAAEREQLRIEVWLSGQLIAQYEEVAVDE